MNTQQIVPVITLDGPSGTGKGTICRMLSRHLRWHCLDSGSLYRVLALAVHRSGIDISDVTSIAAIAKTFDVNFTVDNEQNFVVLLHGENVTKEIRTEECGQLASKISIFKEVRDALLARQRAFAKKPGLVADGRDMGTVVFPTAKVKLYLDASVEERARRRYLQLQAVQNNVSLARVLDELVQRDARDTERSYAPLKPAHDAVLIDTTGLTIDQVFNLVLQVVNDL